jgi:hypothetical protein
MGLNLETYAALRPMLYHCTAYSNLAGIRAGRALYSVVVLAPGRQLVRRLDDDVVECDQHVITLRDQRALHRRYVMLIGGSSWNDVVVANNSRVFFWPGTQDGPIRHGFRFWQKYRARPDVMLRMGLRELLQVNPDALPYFCRFNSGAPRTVRGRKSPRGRDTFLLTQEWPYPPWRVVEVSFVGSVSLPPTTDVWDGAHRWQRL